MTFLFDFFEERWTCGDGCCSESNIIVDISKNGRWMERREGIFGVYSREEAEEYAKNLIEQNYELKEGEYELEIDDPFLR